MKKIYFIPAILVTVIISSCSGEDMDLAYEAGIYKFYKQEISDIHAFTDNREIDGSPIIVTGPAGKTGDILIVDMEPRVDALREPTVGFNAIYLGKKSRARILCPTCLDNPLQINIKNDSLFLTPKNPGMTMKFAPYTETGLVTVNGEEAERHATLQGKMAPDGFIISTYNIFIKSSGITKGTADANYLDLDYLKSELRENDTLVYVKKETYFRK